MISIDHAYEPNCAAGANSLYPHPTDSTKYIKCVGGQATVEHCIPGMIFSKIRKYCDYESRVKEYDSEAANGYNVLGGTDEDGAATVTFSGGKCKLDMFFEVQRNYSILINSQPRL